MMGRSHALTGTLAFACATLVIDIHNPVQIVLGVCLATGGALLPDIDHKNATASKTYGPITQALCWVIGNVLGGHRKGTHCIAGIAALWIALDFATRHAGAWPARVLLVFVMSLAMSAAIRLLHIRGWLDDVLPIPFAITLVWLMPDGMNVVGPAIALGCATHVLGDMLTPSGCPVLWPLSDKKYRFNLFVTGSWPERYVVVPLTVLGITGIVVWQIANGLGLVNQGGQ